MTAIFISHASQDSEEATAVQVWLNEQGLDNVFLDLDKADGLRAGENWERRLYEEVARCHAVVLVVTPSWLASKWCFAEFSMARSLGKVIFPVWLSSADISQIGPELGSIQAEHWTEEGRVHLATRLRGVAHEIARGHRYSSERPPYPGFLSFEQEDAAIFFGRDPEIREISERLEARRVQGGASMLFVLGPSGSGKSSVVKAGVLPWLGREKRRWVVLPSVRPGGEPVTRLAKALAEAMNKPDDWRQFREKLFSARRELLTEILDALQIAKRSEATILITIDQFEEAIANPDNREQAVFLELLELIGSIDTPFMVLATIRSDLMGEVLKLKGFTVPHEVYTLGRMPANRLPQVIEGPAGVAALQVEDGLTNRIIGDAISTDALPLLAFTLRELHDRYGNDSRLTNARYEALGDPAAGLSPLENSIRRKAEETIRSAAAGTAEMEALKEAFVNGLVRANDQGVRLRKLAQMDELPELARPMIQMLIKARLLSARGDDGELVIEVAHEALLRAWPQLSNWLDDEQDFLIGRRQIEEARQIWEITPPGKKDTALLSGILLEKARNWSAEHSWRLARTREFVEASIEKEKAAYRLRRRRLRALTFSAITAAVVFAVLGAAAAVQWNRAQQSADHAAQEAERAHVNELAAQAANRDADLRFSLALGAVAAGLSEDDPRLALFLAGEAVARADGPPGYFARSAIIEARQKLSTGEPHVLGSPIPAGDALSSALSPDGKLIAIGDRNGQLTLIPTLRDGPRPASFQAHLKGIEDLAFSPDSTSLASVGDEGDVRIWTISDGSVVAGEVLARFDDVAWSVAFDNTGTQVAATSASGEIRIWDVGGDMPVMLSRLAGDGDMLSVAFSRDQQTLLTGAGSGTIFAWDIGRQEGEFDLLKGVHSSDIWQLQFSPTGDQFATVSSDGTSVLFDYPDGIFQSEVFTREQKIFSIAFSQAGEFLIGGSDDGSLHMLNLSEPGRPMKSAAGHTGRIVEIEASESGTLLASLGRDQNARLWSLFDPVPVSIDHKLENAAKGVVISADGSVVAAADKTGHIHIWRDHGETVRSFPGHDAEIWALALSVDGTRLASADRSGEVQLWDLASARSLAKWKVGDGAIWSVVFSPDGVQIYAAGDDGLARIRTLDLNADPVRLFDLANLTGATISPDGRLIATTGNNGSVGLFNLAENREVIAFEVVDDIVWHASFSGDGRTLAVSAADETVTLWDVETGEKTAELGGHNGGATNAAFLSDQASLVAVDRRGQLHFWDILTGRRLSLPVRAHRRASWRLSVSGKNNSFVTTGDDGLVRMWDILSEFRACDIGAPGFDKQREIEYFGEGVQTRACLEATE